MYPNVFICSLTAVLQQNNGNDSLILCQTMYTVHTLVTSIRHMCVWWGEGVEFVLYYDNMIQIWEITCVKSVIFQTNICIHIHGLKKTKIRFRYKTYFLF